MMGQPRRDPIAGPAPTHFFRPVGQIRAEPVILVHVFIIYFYGVQTQTA
jgi:hypothetical protein